MECRDARAARHIPECWLTLWLASMQQTNPACRLPAGATATTVSDRPLRTLSSTHVTPYLTDTTHEPSAQSPIARQELLQW
jgi:hypothetical protein